MKRLWLRWIALALFVIVLAATFVRLGEWQLHRLDWRKETNAQVVANSAKAIQPYQAVFDQTPVTDDEQWQRVTATGTFDGDNQFLAMFRTRSGDSGSEVITPLKTNRGEYLLVDRGFIKRDRGTQENIAIPAAPTGAVTVTGYVRRSENGKASNITVVDNRMRLVNSSEIAKVLPYPVLDGYLGATEVSGQSAELLPMVTPELGEGPHLSYAIQWFCFTAIAVAGMVVLIRGDLRDRAKMKQQAATQLEGDVDGSRA
ncbi:MAG TPA: SURF1 family protein [Candidatus Luteococcus avicola]|nr:SURF1 family protein [Candidatus Luteococcus avicola]